MVIKDRYIPYIARHFAGRHFQIPFILEKKITSFLWLSKLSVVSFSENTNFVLILKYVRRYSKLLQTKYNKVIS